MLMDLSDLLGGRVALVTGGGRGIGRGVATQESRGLEVAVAARSADELDETVELIAAAGGKSRLVEVDLADPEGATRLASGMGWVDLLDNKAATVGPLGPTSSLAPEDVRMAFGLNVVAVMTLTGALAPAMVDRGRGRVVNVSSGIVARPFTMVGGTVFTATKAAVEAHTVNLVERARRDRCDGQRLPARHRRHRDAGAHPRLGPGAGGRWTRRAFRADA